MSGNYEWDVFLSHATEDKADVVVPLADALRAKGIKVWLDTASLTVGDSLNRSIDGGLSKARFGVVVLSPHFFEKEWSRRELDGLVAREVEGVKVILPVWHNIDKQGVLQFSPTLADRLAAKTSKGIDAVAAEIAQAINAPAAHPANDREWLEPLEAISKFCNQQIVASRDKYWAAFQDAKSRYHETEAEMQGLAQGGWNDRPDALEKYQLLQKRWDREGSSWNAAQRGLRDAWVIIMDEIGGWLFDGSLVAKGFSEPYKAGDGALQVKPEEWHILALDPEKAIATKKSDGVTIYSGVKLCRLKAPAVSSPNSPLEIIFDTSNHNRRFWSLESPRDEKGNPIPGSHWEYRVLVRNSSNKTLRNVRAIVEAFGALPTRPEHSIFDLNKQPVIDLNPHGETLAVLRRWFNPPIVQGMVMGGAYGPLKITVSADDVLPSIKFFHFEPENNPMVSELLA